MNRKCKSYQNKTEQKKLCQQRLIEDNKKKSNKMHKQRPKEQMINQPTYSSPLNSPTRIQNPYIHSPIHQSPFQMITTQENVYNTSNPSQNNLQCYRGAFYRHFARQDLHRNPLAQSVEGQKQRELGDSQVVSRAKLGSEQKESYLAQYQVDEEDIKQQVSSPVNSQIQDKQKPHLGFKNVFTTPFIYSYQNLQNQLDSTLINYAEHTKAQQNYSQQNQYQKKQNIIPKSPHESCESQLMPSYKNMSISCSENDQISEVKYRFDELLKKFPLVPHARGNQDLRRKPMNMFETSAPQLHIKRSVCMQQNHLNQLLHNYGNQQDPINERTAIRPIAHTEINISLPYSSNKPSYIPYQKSYHPESLNYSSSIQNGSTTQHQQKASMQALYQQIRQQQEVIESYKKIIYRLQNDNFRLCSLLIQEGNSQQQKQQLKVRNNNKSTTNQMILSLQSKINVLEEQRSQLCKQVTTLNSVIEEMMVMRGVSNSSKDERRNEHTSSHSQQTSLVKISTAHHLTPPCQLSYKTLHAQLQSVPVQTSFTNTITSNFNQFNYKRLYQKQIEYQQRVKQQMHELQMIQYAYDEQFRKVLQQIEQIKRNRGYYQQLKREIKKEKSRSRSKGHVENKQTPRYMKFMNQNYSTPTTTRLNQQITSAQKQILLPKNNNPIQVNTSTQHSPMLSRIFQNQIIYQLKTQNQILKANLQKITNQIIANQSHQQYQQHQQQQYQQQQQQQHHHHQSQHSHLASHPNFPKSLVKSPVTHSAVLNEIKNPNLIKNNLQFAKIKDRSNSKLTIVEKLKKRPHSISQIQILQDKNDSLNKSQLNKSRRNGSISITSSNDLNYNKVNTPHQMQKRIPLSASKYKNNLILSETIKNTSQKQISQQKSSNFTQQQSQEMIVSRYNNFIKNMKKKFGINSQIIGKEIKNEEITKKEREK